VKLLFPLFWDELLLLLGIPKGEEETVVLALKANNEVELFVVDVGFELNIFVLLLVLLL